MYYIYLLYDRYRMSFKVVKKKLYIYVYIHLFQNSSSASKGTWAGLLLPLVGLRGKAAGVPLTTE